MRRTICFYVMVSTVLILLQGSRSDHPITAYNQYLPEEILDGGRKDLCKHPIINTTLEFYSKSNPYGENLQVENDHGQSLKCQAESVAPKAVIADINSQAERVLTPIKEEGQSSTNNVRLMRTRYRNANHMQARNRNARRQNVENSVARRLKAKAVKNIRDVDSDARIIERRQKHAESRRRETNRIQSRYHLTLGRDNRTWRFSRTHETELRQEHISRSLQRRDTNIERFNSRNTQQVESSFSRFQDSFPRYNDERTTKEQVQRDRLTPRRSELAQRHRDNSLSKLRQEIQTERGVLRSRDLSREGRRSFDSKERENAMRDSSSQRDPALTTRRCDERVSRHKDVINLARYGTWRSYQRHTVDDMKQVEKRKDNTRNIPRGQDSDSRVSARSATTHRRRNERSYSLLRDSDVQRHGSEQRRTTIDTDGANGKIRIRESRTKRDLRNTEEGMDNRRRERRTDNRIERLTNVRTEGREMANELKNVHVDGFRRHVRETRSEMKAETRRDTRDEGRNRRNRQDVRSRITEGRLDTGLQRRREEVHLDIQDRIETTLELSRKYSVDYHRRTSVQSTRDTNLKHSGGNRDVDGNRELRRSARYERKHDHELYRERLEISRSVGRQDRRRATEQNAVVRTARTKIPDGYTLAPESGLKSFASNFLSSLDIATTSRAVLLGVVGFMGQSLWQKTV